MATSCAKSFNEKLTSGSTTTVYVIRTIKNEHDFINNYKSMPRCHHCRKKTHLEFKCKCSSEKVFCSSCRTTEVHGCVLVYQPIELVKVVEPKVQKI